VEDYGYTKQAQNNLLNKCRESCESCEEDSTCPDDKSFKDASGYTCREWQGYNCYAAVEDYGYTKQAQNNLLNKCRKSCESCKEEDESRPRPRPRPRPPAQAPTPAPAPAPTQAPADADCTSVGKDVWGTGKKISCCPGFEECTEDRDRNDRWYSQWPKIIMCRSACN
jgi:hypothetical protein